MPHHDRNRHADHLKHQQSQHRHPIWVNEAHQSPCSRLGNPVRDHVVRRQSPHLRYGANDPVALPHPADAHLRVHFGSRLTKFECWRPQSRVQSSRQTPSLDQIPPNPWSFPRVLFQNKNPRQQRHLPNPNHLQLRVAQIRAVSAPQAMH